ncbi:hypothetical protein PV325_012430 [Microctonus aethiopoides]|nr:hypothetical protein PV325_012430 [Microctonus aethiopoides]
MIGEGGKGGDEGGLRGPSVRPGELSGSYGLWANKIKMKFVLAAVLCTLAVKTVVTMPVAEPGVQSDQLAVVPLEKNAPVLATEHVLRRETPETAAPTVSEHQEGETAEEHAKHAHLVARLDDKAENPEPVKAQDPKLLAEEVKVAESTAEKSEDNKQDDLLKDETLAAAKAVAADIITPAETLAPIPAVPAVPSAIESKPEAPITEGKNAPAKEIDSELKEEIKSEELSSKAVEKIEEPQPLPKSSLIAPESAAPVAAAAAAATENEAPKEEKKIEAVVAESEPKSAEEPKDEVKKAEDKTDRVTRGTEESAPVEAAKPAAPIPAPSPAVETAAAVAEPEPKLALEKKEEEIKLPEKKIEAVEIAEPSKEEKKPELAKATEHNPVVEASEAAASAVAGAAAAAAEAPKEAEKKDELADVKSEVPSIQAKIAPAPLETQSSEAAAAPTEIKSEQPVAETIKAKSEPIEESKESIEAIKAENSSSSEEKSSEENQSGEKLEKSPGAKSVDVKKDESKAEELPKPQEVKELKKSE